MIIKTDVAFIFVGDYGDLRSIHEGEKIQNCHFAFATM